MTLYYIGPRPAKPALRYQQAIDDPEYEKDKLKERPDLYEPGYTRPWLGKEKTGPVVFLSDDPSGIWNHHGIRGNLYAYRVPMSVIKQSGGIHRYDYGREILIPETLWGQVEFMGKVPESKFKQLREEYFFNYPLHGLTGDQRKDQPAVAPEKVQQELQKKLQQHSQRQKVQKRVEKETRRRKSYGDLTTATLIRSFLNSLSKFDSRLDEDDLPLLKDHRWYRFAHTLFDHWSSKVPVPTYGVLSRVIPNAALRNVHKIEPGLWKDLLRNLEYKIFY